MPSQINPAQSKFDGRTGKRQARFVSVTCSRRSAPPLCDGGIGYNKWLWRRNGVVTLNFGEYKGDCEFKLW